MRTIYHDYLMDGKELKKLILKRLAQIGNTVYGMATFCGQDATKVNQWIYYHSANHDRKVIHIGPDEIHDLCDSIGIRICYADEKYLLILRPLEFVTMPMYPKYSPPSLRGAFRDEAIPQRYTKQSPST